MNVGHFNSLQVVGATDHGLTLRDEQGHKILLPKRYVTPEMKRGQSLDVFVYTDSDDRPVATTERPFAEAGTVALLKVVAVNRIGAFLDWGLAKDLLVPFSEQPSTMKPNGVYPVYVYADASTGRMVASGRINKFIGNLFPDFRPMQPVEILVLDEVEMGWKCIVDNAHWGMLYHSDLFGVDLRRGDKLQGYVKKVRSDGKLDLTLKGRNRERIDALAQRITGLLHESPYASLPVNESSSPERIEDLLACSKKDFKKAVGQLLRQQLITISNGEIFLRS